MKDATLRFEQLPPLPVSPMGGGEAAFLARQDIASAYQQVASLRKEKARHLEAQT